MLISGDIPSMAHWCFWWSPSPQLFFFFFFFVRLFVCQSSVSLFHFIICLLCSGVNRVPKCDVIENEICEIMGFVKIF